MREKIIIIVIFMFLLVGCVSNNGCQGGYVKENDKCIINVVDYVNKDKEWIYDYNGIEREYVLYIPEGIESGAPIVFVLHGYTGDAIGMPSYSKMNEVADQHKFAVVYPQGLLYENNTHWNADFDFSTVDDEGFLMSLATDISNRFDLSDTNIFISGHSNGGYMGYAMSKNQPGFFKAMASVSGTMSYNAWNSEDPSIPTNVLQIHGTKDATIPIDGTMPFYGGWGGAPKMTEVIEYWKGINDVSILTQTSIEDTTIYKYTSEENDNQVWYYELEGFDHPWPYAGSVAGDHTSGIEPAEVIWEFFSNFVE